VNMECPIAPGSTRVARKPDGWPPDQRSNCGTKHFFLNDHGGHIEMKNPTLLSNKISTTRPPAPMNHVKIFKGWPLQDALLKLVKLWYKSFPIGRYLP